MADLTEFEQAALRILASNAGTYPSAFASVLMERGIMEHSKPHHSRQGLGFIGGKVLWSLRRKGYAVDRAEGWSVSNAGAAWVASHA